MHSCWASSSGRIYLDRISSLIKTTGGFALILGIYGHHDSGKTLFLERLMKELVKRGISAAAIKHMGGHYEPDSKTDTGRLAAADMNPVVGVADGEAIIHLKGKMGLNESIRLVEGLADTDVIFVEGFKQEPIDKIAVGDIESLTGTKFRAEQFDEIVDYIDGTVKAEKDSRGSCSCGCAKHH